MDSERLKIIIDEWYDYIGKNDLVGLEKLIEMPIKDFIMQLLQNIYNYYKDDVTYISTDKDRNLEYIIAAQKGVYSLEDFLINRLLRNISAISYKKQLITPESHYQYEFGEVLIDKECMENKLKSVYQRRKVLASEVLHALKTQMLGRNIFRSESYFHLKERLKAQIPDVINDFYYFEGSGQNSLYGHIGLYKKNDLLDINDVDEAFNEANAVRFTGDRYKQVVKFNSGLCISLDNIESPNSLITNYASVIEKLFDKESLFEGMYLDPDSLTNKFNKMYNHIFQENYYSSKTATEILIEQFAKIKSDPNNTNNHLTLLETIHECMEQNSILNNQSEEEYEKNIMCLGYYGLLEYKDNTLRPYEELSYRKEYDTIRDKIKNKM